MFLEENNDKNACRIVNKDIEFDYEQVSSFTKANDMLQNGMTLAQCRPNEFLNNIQFDGMNVDGKSFQPVMLASGSDLPNNMTMKYSYTCCDITEMQQVYRKK